MQEDVVVPVSIPCDQIGSVGIKGHVPPVRAIEGEKLPVFPCVPPLSTLTRAISVIVPESPDPPVLSDPSRTVIDPASP